MNEGAFVHAALGNSPDSWGGRMLYSLAAHYGFSLDTPFKDLAEEHVQILFYGTKGEQFDVVVPPLAGSNWGHLHLRVTDLDRSEAFYRDQLGLEVMQRSFPGARFMATDGYHHHLGLNTWGGPRLPLPPGALGLAEATFARVGTAAESNLADPDAIHLRVQPALVPA